MSGVDKSFLKKVNWGHSFKTKSSRKSTHARSDPFETDWIECMFDFATAVLTLHFAENLISLLFISALQSNK